MIERLFSRLCVALASAGLVMVPTRGNAETKEEPGGTKFQGEHAASDGQPGVYRVPIAAPTLPMLAATLGYGYTEPQYGDDGAHHRFSTRLAAAASVAPWLSLGALTDVRHDVHPNDSGTMVDAALVTRFSAGTNDSRVGAEFKGRIPGSEQFSTSLGALSLDSRILFAQRFGRLTLATSAGYRLDRGSRAGTSASRLSFSDRLALGLSDFDSVLLGVGAILPLGRTSILLELSGDVLVGSGAPTATKSPLRGTVGIRQVLSGRLSADFLVDTVLSGRPDLSPSTPLIPVEPRITFLAGLRYSFSIPEEPASRPMAVVPAIAAPVVVPPTPQPPTKPTDAYLEVVVVDDQGSMLPDAVLQLSLAGKVTEFKRDEQGRYQLEHVPEGSAELSVSANGFETAKRNFTVQGGTPQKVEIQLVALPPTSQLRGVVRSFGGKGLAAKVRVMPIGIDASTDGAGAFQLDVPPGNYEVAIEAQGYESQRRKVQVEPSGVVILNADLVKKR